MAVAFALFFIPFEELLHSFFYFHFVRPSERMQFAYVNEFSHGAVGLAGVKLNRPFEAYGFGYEMWELAYGKFLARTNIDVAVI